MGSFYYLKGSFKLSTLKTALTVESLQRAVQLISYVIYLRQ